MDAPKRDYYEVLGVPRDADADTIRAAYRKLARRHHPDVSDEPDAHARFQEIGEAYAVLSDPEKRAHYDRFGHAGPEGFGFDLGVVDLFDLFQSVVGGFGFQQPRVGGGRDLEYQLPITLEDVATGLETQIAVSHLVACEECGGEGAAPGTSRERCPTCQGVGRVRYRQTAMLLTFMQEADCPDCGGSGIHIPTPCDSCGGSGRRRQTEKISVNIPAGIQDGQRIRYRGRGDAGPLGTPPGDLYVIIHVQPHETFVRRGADLACEVEIEFPQAALGDVIQVPGILGPHELVIPPGTQHGTALTVRGGGLPEMGQSNRTGDLHVLIRIRVPERLSKRQREILHNLAEEMGLNITPPDPSLRRKIGQMLRG
ncbi:MAG: molecular chaperone DnaJ [Candidatus Zipacnadales bacterium]